MNLAVFNIQDWVSVFKDAQRWAVKWASGYGNALTYYKTLFKASTEGYKEAAGCRKDCAKVVSGATSNAGCLVSCIIPPVVLNKQLWHRGRGSRRAGVGFTLINGQQEPRATAAVRGAAEKHKSSPSDMLLGKRLFSPGTLHFLSSWVGDVSEEGKKRTSSSWDEFK